MNKEGFFPMYEEFEVSKSATFVAGLPFGEGKIGISPALKGQEEYDAFAQALGDCTVPLTVTNTADCVDGRRTIALGNGINDDAILEQRVAPQLPGGLVLAVTKAAVGADIAILRDAKGFKDAYLKMYDVLTALGYEDGGHKGCGASGGVESSVTKHIDDDPLFQTVSLLTPVDDSTANLVRLGLYTKQKRLAEGFYGDWSSEWHEGFLMDKVPHNFSILEADHTETHGHRELATYTVTSDGFGFAKNRFISRTGQQAFGETIATADKLTSDIIAQIGGSAEERARLRLEFAVDTPQVFNGLAVKGMPVFAEAA
jgi:hypothetical protein